MNGLLGIDGVSMKDLSRTSANVLLVDDNPANLLALRVILEDLGQVLARLFVARVVKVRALPREDPHVIELRLSGRRLLRLLVVPPAMSAGKAEEAMLAAATPRHSYTASSILEVVAESHDHDKFDEWHDTGGSWWDPHPLAPSCRPEADLAATEPVTGFEPATSSLQEKRSTN